MDASTRTLTTRRRWVRQSTPRNLAPADSVRTECIRLLNQCFPRSAKLYGAFVSPWELSRARKDGGPVFALVRYLRAAAPEDRYRIAAFVRAFVESLDGPGQCAHDLTLESVETNAADELASSRFLADRDLTRAEIEDLADAK